MLPAGPHRLCYGKACFESGPFGDEFLLVPVCECRLLPENGPGRGFTIGERLPALAGVELRQQRMCGLHRRRECYHALETGDGFVGPVACDGHSRHREDRACVVRFAGENLAEQWLGLVESPFVEKQFAKEEMRREHAAAKRNGLLQILFRLPPIAATLSTAENRASADRAD